MKYIYTVNDTKESDKPVILIVNEEQKKVLEQLLDLEVIVGQEVSKIKDLT